MLRGKYGDLVFEHPIRVSARHKAGASHHKTIYQYDGKRSRGRVDYERLTAAVVERARLDRVIGRAASSHGEGACALPASSASF
jgi:cellulose biosynthesis protein BcsQ